MNLNSIISEYNEYQRTTKWKEMLQVKYIYL